MAADTPKTQLPHHIAFIPDGNRRWAKANNISSLEGHKQGGDVAKKISRSVFAAGIPVMSIYAFSTENWNRTADEVQYLMDLYLRFAGIELKEAMRDNIKIVVSGSEDRLSKRILSTLGEIQSKTAGNTGGTLNICLNYGGQDEIIHAVKSLMRDGLTADDISADSFKQHLYTKDLPPVDLVVRTSGEQRLSNFLLWDAAYAELSFPEVMWPDFDQKQLDLVLSDYATRQRRFGS